MMNLKLHIRQYIKMAAQNVYLPAVYACSLCAGRLLKRRDPVGILFADAHHDRCPESMRTLRAWLKQRNIPVRELYLDYQKASFWRTLAHMTRFMRLYARSDAVVISDNFLPVAGCRKREGTKVLQLWHACGSLKRFGYDTQDDIPASYRGNVFRNIDRVTVSSPLCVKPFAAAMRLPESSVWPAGVSRTDRYFREQWRQAQRQRFYEKMPDARGKKVVVWAPTFRGNPGAPRRLPLDLEALRRQLGEEYIVIEKQHPHIGGDASLAGFMTTEELFPVTDVLIADYSSLIYEYLLFDGGLVLYIPDYDSYTSNRGFYMDYGEIPGLRVTREEDLAQAVRLAGQKERGADGEEARRLFLERWMCACDGNSTRRIAGYLLGGPKTKDNTGRTLR